MNAQTFNENLGALPVAGGRTVKFAKQGGAR